MLEVKHTPGPWEAIEHPKDWIIKQRVKTASELRFPALIARAERTANARLIAAAPDLLEALHRVNHTLSVHGKMDGDTDLREFVCAAIAKATAP